MCELLGIWELSSFLKSLNRFIFFSDSLTDLFNSAYLPKSRVARKFENHNFSVLQPFLGANREQAERQLALWYFEDQLALAYEKLVRHLKQVRFNLLH